MGHEYVEMKNSHAAIEAYRKAVGTYHTGQFVDAQFAGQQLNELCGVIIRRQQKGLPGVVRSSPGVRAPQYASIRIVLLPARHSTPVSTRLSSVEHCGLRDFF